MFNTSNCVSFKKNTKHLCVPMERRNDKLSVSERRRYFEELAKVKRKEPPEKPKRTFAEDQYFDPQTLVPVRKNRLNSVPLVKTVDFPDYEQFATLPRQSKKFQLQQPVYINDDVRVSNVYEEINTPEIERKTMHRKSYSFQNLTTCLGMENESKNSYYFEFANRENRIGRIYASAGILNVTHYDKDSTKEQKNVLANPYDVPNDPIPVTVKKASIMDADSNISDGIENRVSRAKLIRRQSIPHYDHQVTLFLKKKSQLFDLVVLIALKLNDKSDKRYTKRYMPVISFVYPKDKSERFQTTLASLPCLCFPEINSVTFNRQIEFTEEQFVMTLTDNSGDRKFAYGHKFIMDESDQQKHSASTVTFSSLPLVLCTISPVPATQFYQQFSCEAVARAKISIIFLEDFVRQSYGNTLPSPNSHLKVIDRRNQKDTLMYNKPTENDMHLVLKCFGVKDMILLFVSMLTEGRILLVGSDVSILSKVVQSASKMLAPFTWPHTMIPLIPDSLLDFVQSPSPYFMGVLRSCLPQMTTLCGNEEDEFIFVYDLDFGKLEIGKKLDTYNEEGKKIFRIRPMKKLEQNLSDILNASPETMTPSLMDSSISKVFLMFFVDILGNYRDYITTKLNGVKQFDEEKFIKSTKSKERRKFLKYFVETGMFQVWMDGKIKRDLVFSDNDTNKTFDEMINVMKSGKKGVLNSLAKRFNIKGKSLD